MSDLSFDMNKMVIEAEDIIFSYLPESTGFSAELREAMNYSVRNGGKRLRPILMYLTFNMLNGSDNSVKPFMAAIEMIHSYSLVHDDLPAMDNDKFRRGKKSTWYEYDHATGILAGDGLLNLAFETALKAFDETQNAANVINALKCLGEKAGIYGMVGGQSADVANTGNKLTAELLDYIYSLKTCALLEASFMTAGYLAGADLALVSKLSDIGHNLGMAFQIQDDILDITGDESKLGKPVHSDELNDKYTYATIFGIEKARAAVNDYSNKAMLLLEQFEDNIYRKFIKEIFVMLINRDR